MANQPPQHATHNTAKRSGFYILFQSKIGATARPDGTFTQEIYLEGRLPDKAKYVGGITDEKLLELLTTCAGFRQLVHSIGISIKVEEGEHSDIQFSLHNWEKSSKYESSSTLNVQCKADGTEAYINLNDHDWSQKDDVLGKLSFHFASPEAIATASIIFYLNEGFTAPQFVVDEPVNTESSAYCKLVKQSLLHRGNNKRLKKAIDKARRGEDVTIAYIGGSITQGASAVPIHNTCYAYQSYSLFKKTFGNGNGEHIHFIKTGVGGTPSELGMIRYERDVLRHGSVQPDVVIIEFAVNDRDDETNGICYESLVLRALLAPNKPAVILLFSVFINDWNLQDRLAPVGMHYDLPMVSVKDALVEQFYWSKAEGNVITKRQYFYDSYHPTNIGHMFMADCLNFMFTMADAAIADQQDLDLVKPPIIGNDFVHINLLDRAHNTHIAELIEGGFHETDHELQLVEMDDQAEAAPQFPYNWMHRANSGSASFKMTIRSKALLLVFKDSGSNDFGSADVFVDDKLVLTADPLIASWTHCHAVILYNEPEVCEHMIEIRMASGHEHKQFTILGFGFVS